MVFACPRCGSLVRWVHACRSAAKAGWEPGAGCTGKECVPARRWKPHTFWELQASRLEGVVRGELTLILTPESDAVATLTHAGVGVVECVFVRLYVRLVNAGYHFQGV